MIKHLSYILAFWCVCSMRMHSMPLLQYTTTHLHRCPPTSRITQNTTVHLHRKLTTMQIAFLNIEMHQHFIDVVMLNHNSTSNLQIAATTIEDKHQRVTHLETHGHSLLDLHLCCPYSSIQQRTCIVMNLHQELPIIQLTTMQD